MDEASVRSALFGVYAGEIRYAACVGSTNDEALIWANEGAADLSVIVADEQTRGRGRMARQWLTPPGSALALSVVLRPQEIKNQPAPAVVMQLTALGALAVTAALETYGIRPQIKWPNDVLLAGRKTAGILVEAAWEGQNLAWAVVGIGLNVKSKSVPPDDQLRFPATCVETVLGLPVDRAQLLREILTGLAAQRAHLGSAWLTQAWQARLAYLNQQIVVENGADTRFGRLIGLAENGGLRVELAGGERVVVTSGELRPVLDGGLG